MLAKLPPPRTKGQRAKILALLRERGRTGVLSSELYEFPHLYGRCPGSRICELRKDGYAIEGERRGEADWRYWLLPEEPVRTPERETPKASDEEQLPLFQRLHP
jgi:hypothetical protein